METEIGVSCHAPTLSLLLFETVRSAHDQKGLLIGEICKHVVSEKTDDNEMNRLQRTTIYLEHCIPFHENDIFNNVGNINEQVLEKYIRQYDDKIVGWYSFRRNTRVNCRSLKETMIHKSLIKSLYHVRPEYFVAAFMSASVGASLSTHTYNHVFMRFLPDREIFEPLKLKIYTMSDKAVGGNGYMMKNSLPTSRNFDNIIKGAQEGDCSVMSVLTINKCVGDHLKTINKKLQEAESQRYELEKQIKNLRKRLMLDDIQDVKVRELVQEKKGNELLYMQCIRYNNKQIYNPNRTENPLRVEYRDEIPTVPKESEKVQMPETDQQPSLSGSPSVETDGSALNICPQNEEEQDSNESSGNCDS